MPAVRGGQSVWTWLLAAGLLAWVAALALSWRTPILEMHSFRQTQTAISAYWMAFTPHWLAYPTPVLGYPWTIPLEFPLFQGVVSLVSETLPINLDQAGRLMSWIAGLAVVWPLRDVLQRIPGGSRRLADTASVLYLFAPVYMFWSRAFLIESTALLLSVGYVALVCRQLAAPTLRTGLLLAGLASLAALVKITTFFGFAACAAILVVVDAWSARDRLDARELLRRYAPVALSVALALVALRQWVQFSDALKHQAVWGNVLESSGLSLWNFGTLEQRMSAELWRGVVFGRAARETLGFAWILVPLGLAALIGRQGSRGIALSALALYLLPFAIFTNLHIVHNYYQMANALFLIVFAACGLTAIVPADAKRPWLPLATAAISLAMVAGFQRDFLPVLRAPAVPPPTLQLARFVRDHTAADEVVIGFGLDWSPEVPYYATRRAMLVPDWLGPDVLKTMLGNPSRYAGSARVGMVIVCPNHFPERPDTRDDYRALMVQLTVSRRETQVASCSLYR